MPDPIRELRAELARLRQSNSRLWLENRALHERIRQLAQPELPIITTPYRECCDVVSKL